MGWSPARQREQRPADLASLDVAGGLGQRPPPFCVEAKGTRAGVTRYTT